jgi:hypothetical protein
MTLTVPQNPDDNKIDNIIITPKTEALVTVTNTIVNILRAEPGRAFSISDIFHHTGSTRQAVKMALSRLSSPKNSAPVKRVGRGFYKYAPEKDKAGLDALIRSGNWKVENITLVTKGAYPTPLLSFQEPGSAPETGSSNSQQPTPRAGYPWSLPTGQCVNWERYDNGTEMIRLSVNGAPPFSPDHALTLIDILRRKGLDDSWVCVSIEVNVDSRDLRFNSSISLQVLEGLLLKCYQHGPWVRLELADRRRCGLGEVMALLTGLAGSVDAREALQQCEQLREEVKEIGSTARLALNNSRKVREKVEDLTKPAEIPTEDLAPTYRTGADIFKGMVAKEVK